MYQLGQLGLELERILKLLFLITNKAFKSNYYCNFYIFVLFRPVYYELKTDFA